MSELVFCAWTVKAVICVGYPLHLKKNQTQEATAKLDSEQRQVAGEYAVKHRSEPPIYIYTRYVEMVLDCPKRLRDQVILLLAAWEGLRSGEISSLCWEMIDLEHGLLHVLDSKKRTVRLVPLRFRVAKYIALYIQEVKITHGFLIQQLRKHPRKPGSKTRGAGISITQLDKILWNYCDLLDVPRMDLRKLRSYCALTLHDRRVPMNVIKAWLGHDDIQSTEHYLGKLVDVKKMLDEAHRLDVEDGETVKVTP